jgi:hypothetical protein
MARAVKGADSGLTKALRSNSGLLKSLKNFGKSVKNFGRRGATAGTDTALTAKALKNPDEVATSFKQADEAANAAEAEMKNAPLSKTNPKNEPTGELTATGAKQASRLSKVSKYLPSKGTIIAGLAVTTFLAAAGIYLDSTDGVEVDITKIEQAGSGSTGIIVTYATRGDQTCLGVPCIQGAFNPTKNDTFTFIGTPGLDGTTHTVTEVVSDNSVLIDATYTPSSGSGGGSLGRMKCHSDFTNQFAGAIRNTTAFAADAAAAAAAGAASGLCAAIEIPIICTGGLPTWVLWTIGGVCLCLCMFLIFMMIPKK